MDARPSAVRGGSWRRGGRGGNNSDSVGGEPRGRGRGGHHRGRGKRDHYRGRARGGSGHSAEFHHRDEDEGDNFQEEGDRTEVFSRRKLGTNWDRYEASERQEPDDDTPTQRGTDYHVLLASAGLTEVVLILIGSCCHGCVSALRTTWDGISMDTDQDDTGLWGVGGGSPPVSAVLCVGDRLKETEEEEED